jgi:hypothetical protein
MSKELDEEINFGNINFVSVKSNLIVEIDDNFLLHTEDGGFELKVKIRADLESVPEKYREVFFNMLTTKYLNKTNFSTNPFSSSYKKRKKPFLAFFKDFLN